MKKLFILTILLNIFFSTKAQSILNLDSCRALALANNKELLISNEKINAAHYQRKAAFTNYLPNISATGAYMRNQKEFSLLKDVYKRQHYIRRKSPYIGWLSKRILCFYIVSSDIFIKSLLELLSDNHYLHSFPHAVQSAHPKILAYHRY